jgi:hypothetical protein
MRAGPLSNPKVVDLLNSSFVPVYISNEDYHGASATVPKEEAKLWQKIYADAVNEKRSNGTVCVYLVDADAKGLDSLVVSKAAEKDNLLKMLRSTAEGQKVESGKAVVEPAAQAPAPKGGPTDLVLHLTARVDHKGSWGEFPSENWIVLKEDEWKSWLPAAAEVGATRDISEKEATRVLTYFFPQTEVCTFGKVTDPDGPYQHRIEQITLKARVLGVEGGLLRVRLDGGVRLKHKFYPGHDDENRAESTAIGYLEVDRKTNQIARLRLATTSGQYSRFGFGVAVDSQKGP